LQCFLNKNNLLFSIKGALLDWIFHILVPLGLLALIGIRSKWMLWLLPLTVILDIGTLLDFRRGLHSIFIMLLMLAIIYIACRLSKTKETKLIMAISAFYLASHFFLDLGGPMALFWPASQEAYTVTINFTLQNMVPVFTFAINAVPIGSLEQKTGSVIAEAGFGLLAIFLIIVIAKLIRERKNGSGKNKG
jgi:hypothetical protein